MTEGTALKDALTGADSRGALQELFPAEVARTRRRRGVLALIMIDLDHFKSVNDAFGHRRGDEVLVEFVRRLQHELRASDLLFRYGGDEFVLMVPDTAMAQAQAVADRLAGAISASPFPGDPPLTLTVSMGIAAYPTDGETPEALLERADARHYQAKRSGRGRVVTEDPHAAQQHLAQTGRPVERDGALATLDGFLRELPTRRTGVLAVQGAPGSGQSRFLTEVARAGRLHGLAVLRLSGTGVLREQPYGALAPALRELRLSPPGPGGTAPFRDALRHRLTEKRAFGLLLVVDGLTELDAHTLWLIQEFFADQALGPVALAYSADSGPGLRHLPLDAAMWQEVELLPFSEVGVRLWLRSALRWEPPADFVAWLHQATGGLPAAVKQAVATLVQRQMLRQTAAGWQLAEGYEKEELPEWTRPPLRLPVPETRFIGREEEVQAVKSRLEVRRLVTVLGPGGTGKTRLAIQAASELAGRYPDGIFFVPLAPVGTPELLVPAVGEAVGLALGGPADPRAQLLAHLREKSMLLVLDNFEHLVAGVELVSDILDAAPDIRLLATSRERLRVPGESLLELGGLPLPAAATREMAHSPSVQLFVDRARLLDTGFRLTGEMAPEVAEICRLTAGNPLGLELAAAWVRVLSCQEIAAGIAESLDFLETTQGTAPERQRSLRSTFLHSWHLLSEEERQAFGQLSVFRGGFDRPAARQVAGASVRVLAALMDKSLVRRSSGSRYEVHELLRQFGAEMLAGTETQAASRRHAEHYLALAEDLARELLGPGQAEVAGRLTTEHDNLRAALAWAIENGESVTALRLVVALRMFWWLRGHAAEARNWAEAALGADPQETPSRERALVLGYLGWLLRMNGQVEAASEFAIRGLAMAQRVGDPEAQAEAHNTLACTCLDQGRYQESTDHLTACLALRRELGDQKAVSTTLSNLAVVAFDRGDDEAAGTYLEEALAIRRQMGDAFGASLILNNLGTLCLRTGEYSRAEAFLEESLSLTAPTEEATRALPLHNLGDLALLRGEYEQARAYLLESAAAKRNNRFNMFLAHTLFSLSCVARETGDVEAAWSWCEEGLTGLRHDRRFQRLPAGLVHAAAVACMKREWSRAARLLGAAEGLLASLERVLEAVARREHRYVERCLHREMGPAALQAARAAGAAMSGEEALAYALGQ